MTFLSMSIVSIFMSISHEPVDMVFMSVFSVGKAWYHDDRSVSVWMVTGSLRPSPESEEGESEEGVAGEGERDVDAV